MRCASLLADGSSSARAEVVDAPDLATLAAAYAFGLAKIHGYVDGNKRVAFLAAYVFLGLNGKDLDAAEPDVAATMERLAAGRITETALAGWCRTRIQPLP